MTMMTRVRGAHRVNSRYIGLLQRAILTPYHSRPKTCHILHKIPCDVHHKSDNGAQVLPPWLNLSCAPQRTLSLTWTVAPRAPSRASSLLYDNHSYHLVRSNNKFIFQLVRTEHYRRGFVGSTHPEGTDTGPHARRQEDERLDPLAVVLFHGTLS